MMRTLLLVLLLALPAAHAEEESLLPDGLKRILSRNGIPLAQAGLYVAWGDGEPIALHNLDRPFNPASAIKLVTSMAALDLLGPAHTWESGLYAAAEVASGSLRGDLYFKGSGDPFLTNERLAWLVGGLRRRGVDDVAGDLVVDDSLFALPPPDTESFDGAGTRSYNASPGAALVNFGTSFIHLHYMDGALTVFAEPPSATFTVTSKVRMVRGRCPGNWRQRLLERLVRHDDGSAELTLAGRYYTGCGARSFHLLAQPDAGAHAAGGVIQQFVDAGGTFAGGWRRGEVPAKARLLTQNESPPLAEIIRGVNKYSNNVMARNLFLALDEAEDGPRSLEGARAAVAEWFAAQGIDAAGMAVDNGSGLSRTVRITARQFGEALRLYHAKPYRHELYASLAVLGRDGTVRTWNRNKPVAGRARLKTGTLSNVRATAGVVHNPQGDVLLVVMIETRSTANARRADPADARLAPRARCLESKAADESPHPRRRQGQVVRALRRRDQRADVPLQLVPVLRPAAGGP